MRFVLNPDWTSDFPWWITIDILCFSNENSFLTLTLDNPTFHDFRIGTNLIFSRSDTLEVSNLFICPYSRQRNYSVPPFKSAFFKRLNKKLQWQFCVILCIVISTHVLQHRKKICCQYDTLKLKIMYLLDFPIDGDTVVCLN